MRKFEYKLAHLYQAPDGDSTAEARMNELGAVGWDLVSFQNGICVFKRELLSASQIPSMTAEEAAKLCS